MDFAPCWSPDGRYLAFVSDRAGNFDIFIMLADGSAAVNVTNSSNDEGEPAWAP
jgi:TolB protein